MTISNFLTLARAIDNFKYDQSAENAALLKSMMKLSTYLLPAAPMEDLPEEAKGKPSALIQHIPDLGGVLIAYTDREQAAKAGTTRLMSEVGFDELLRIMKANRSLITNIMLNPEGSVMIFNAVQFLDLFDMPATEASEETLEAGETIRLVDAPNRLPDGFLDQFSALCRLQPQIENAWVLLQKDAGDNLEDRWLVILEAREESDALALSVVRPLSASFQIPLAVCFASNEAASDVVDDLDPHYSK